MFQVGSFYKDMKPIGLLAGNVSMLAITDGATLTGAIIDTQGYERILLVLGTQTMTLATGGVAASLEHGDDSALSDTAVVPTANLNGALPDWILATDDDKLVTVEVMCTKRYLRLTFISTTDAAVTAMLAAGILGQPKHTPVQT